MIVIITDEAEADLEAVGDYIAERNPARAISFIHELRMKCQHFLTWPWRSPLYRVLGIAE